MKPSSMLAILLIAGGIVAVAYQGITYTTREKVVDVGDIHVMADKTKSIPVPRPRPHARGLRAQVAA